MQSLPKCSYPKGLSITPTALVLAGLITWSSVAAAVDPNGYTNLLLADAANDPYQIASELRRQAQRLGYSVYSNPSQLPEEEAAKTCYAIWSWRTGALGGSIELTLHDLLTGTVVGEGDGSAVQWTSVRKAVQVGVRKVWDSIAYRGYSEAAHRRNIATLFPPRPKINLNEEEIRKTAVSSAIEGIWVDPGNLYSIGIIRSPEGSRYDYVGFVLSSRHEIWSPGEVKLELNPTATSGTYIGNLYPANKKRQGATFILANESLLRYTFVNLAGMRVEAALAKAWPSVEVKEFGTPRILSSSGTGFYLGSGLVATNWHVVEDASRIEVASSRNTVLGGAEVAIRDIANDLAVLRLLGQAPEGCPEPPYSLASAGSLALGAKVAVIGFPLSGLLGSEPRYTEGVVSSKTGLDDDPRTIQISAQIQPGSSGSPLLDVEGDVVGVVVSSLSARYLYAVLEAIPQDVNFAVKADYLLSLLGMLPEGYVQRTSKRASPDEVARCVVQVSVSRELAGRDRPPEHSQGLRTGPQAALARMVVAAVSKGAAGVNELGSELVVIGTRKDAKGLTLLLELLLPEPRGDAVWLTPAFLLGSGEISPLDPLWLSISSREKNYQFSLPMPSSARRIGLGVLGDTGTAVLVEALPPSR